MTEPAAPDEKATTASERFVGLTLAVGLIAAVVGLVALGDRVAHRMQHRTAA